MVRTPAFLMLTAAALLGGGAVLANEGGSGGSAPSMSAPSYDPAAEYRKGIEALQAERYLEARKAFERVLGVAPGDANTNLLAGLAAAGLNDLKGARKYYERAVKADKELVGARRELGVTYLKLGEKEKADSQLAALKAMQAKCAGACAKAAEIGGAVQALTAAIGTPPQARLEARPSLLFASAAGGDRAYLDAVALINEGKYEAAIESLTAARATLPAPRRAHLSRLRQPQARPLRRRRNLLQGGARGGAGASRRHRILWRADGRTRRPAGRRADAGQARGRLRLRLRRGRRAAAMDPGRALARFLSAPPLALLPAAAGPDLPLREALWLAPEALYRSLSREPAHCFVRPADPAERRRAAIGRAAFGAPLLLGGQAARAGLSCASCHRNGRGNPDFLFPGLSGPSGTADVTASLMSSHRGDGRFNPRPIPDLGGPRAALKVPQDRAKRALEAFIRGLVVEEFDGPEPSAAVLDGLAAYVRALRPEGCGRGERRISLASRLALVDDAAALGLAETGETRRLLLAAARSHLAAIDERFTVAGGGPARAVLRDADRELRALRSGGGDARAWRRQWPAWKRKLLRLERHSLFDPKRLRTSLAY